MNIEYITMFKDYQGRHKGVRKFARAVEERLLCSVCIEKIPINPGSIRGLDIINTQALWNLL